MRYLIICLCGLILSQKGMAQQPIRVMHYNLLNFGNDCTGADVLDKYNWLGTILEHYQPDIFTVNEISPNVLFSNGIKTASFDYTTTIGFANITNQAGSDIVNQLFYNTNKFELRDESVITNPLRDINVYTLYVKGSGGSNDSLFLTCIVAHFKAQDNSSAATQRQVAAQSIMNWIQANGVDKHILVLGDFNVYSNNEAAFQTMVFNTNSQIRLADPGGKASGWGGGSNAIIHTQSTRSNSPDCGSGGGMDDRFDMILASKKIMDDLNGLHFVAGSYAGYGNNGDSYNMELVCSGSGSVPIAVCAALKQNSDHLPVVLELLAEGVVSNERLNSLRGVELRILGNPVEQELSLELSVDAAKSFKVPFTLEILDGIGKRQHIQVLFPLNERIYIPTISWPVGVYHLIIRDDQGRRLTQTFLKG